MLVVIMNNKTILLITLFLFSCDAKLNKEYEDVLKKNVSTFEQKHNIKLNCYFDGYWAGYQCYYIDDNDKLTSVLCERVGCYYKEQKSN